MRPRFIPYLIVHGALAALVLVVAANLDIGLTTRGGIFTEPRDLPRNEVGLLLGTSPFVRDGRANPFFQSRIRAAVTLLEAGSVSVILASGDNEHRSYNEPLQMRNALVAAGVPEGSIVLDFAGFRTLDSVLRAARVFGQERVTIISQQFHLRRALYIARRNGIDAVAFAAEPVPGTLGVSALLREQLARTLAVLDTRLFRTQPRFLGEPLPIGDGDRRRP